MGFLKSGIISLRLSGAFPIELNVETAEDAGAESSEGRIPTSELSAFKPGISVGFATYLISVASGSGGVGGVEGVIVVCAG